jgi:hypothetical protein
VKSLTQFFGGTKAVWTDIKSPIPDSMLVMASDTTEVKIGNGVSLYADLPVLFKVSDIVNVFALMNTKANIDSPELTGKPRVPTPVAGTTDDQIANCAFINGLISNLLTSVTGKVLVNNADTTPGLLANKLVQGGGIIITSNIVSGNDVLTVSVDPNSLSKVAFTGNYSDLNGIPGAMFDGTYANLTGKPNLSTVAITGNYSDLLGLPALSTVALSGNYSDLSQKPTFGALASKSSVATSDIAANSTLLTYDIPFAAGFGATFAGSDLAAQTYAELVISRNITLQGMLGYIDTPSVGAAVVLDILKDGVSIYTTKPQFAAGSNTLTDGTLSVTTAVAGDRLTFKVTQVGSTTKGQKLRATFKAIVS